MRPVSSWLWWQLRFRKSLLRSPKIRTAYIEVASARGKQYRVRACTSYATIVDFRIEYSAVSQTPSFDCAYLSLFEERASRSLADEARSFGLYSIPAKMGDLRLVLSSLTILCHRRNKGLAEKWQNWKGFGCSHFRCGSTIAYRIDQALVPVRHRSAQLPISLRLYPANSIVVPPGLLDNDLAFLLAPLPLSTQTFRIMITASKTPACRRT